MAIPPVGSRIPAQSVKLQHPDWAERNAELQFYKDAFFGSGGFAADARPFTRSDMITSEDQWQAFWNSTPSFDPTYLQPFPRERQGFILRKRRAHYENVVRPAVLMLLGFLLRRAPLREKYEEMTETAQWMKAVTLKGVSWDDWLRTELGAQLFWSGEAIVVFDRENTGADSLAAQREAEDGGRLVARLIDPTWLEDWSVDDRGRYRWLKIKQTVDVTTDPQAKQHTIVDRYTWYTREGWYSVEVPVTNAGEGASADYMKVTQSQVWAEELSRAPIAVWRVGETGRSLLSDAAPAARMHYNLYSVLMSMIYETGFALLVGPPIERHAAEGEKGGAMEVGSGNYWEEIYRDGETGRGVRFESPDSGPFDVITEILDALGKAIEKMVGLGILEQTSTTTGPGKRFDFAQLNAYLGSLVGDFSEGEHEAMQIVAEQHGEEYSDDIRAQYTNNFEPVDIEALINSLEGLKRVGAPAKVMAEGMKEAIGHVLYTLDEGKRAELHEVIDAAMLMSAAACMGDGPDLDDEDEPPPPNLDGTDVPEAPEV